MRDVVIVDYGMGNLFGVAQACRAVGLEPRICSDPREVQAASGIVIPGVGAFGAAMATLTNLDLVETLRDRARSGTPILGVCLGQQLLLDSTEEYGHHAGLGLVRGTVERISGAADATGPLKVPHVGWNRVWRSKPARILDGIEDGAYMYFVHSYIAKPIEDVEILSAFYGDFRFCAAIEKGNIASCQFHPERSGPSGLRIYANFANILAEETS